MGKKVKRVFARTLCIASLAVLANIATADSLTFGGIYGAGVAWGPGLAGLVTRDPDGLGVPTVTSSADSPLNAGVTIPLPPFGFGELHIETGPITYRNATEWLFGPSVVGAIYNGISVKNSDTGNVILTANGPSALKDGVFTMDFPTGPFADDLFFDDSAIENFYGMYGPWYGSLTLDLSEVLQDPLDPGIFYSPFADGEIVLTQAPEPSTWLLMMSVLGVLSLRWSIFSSSYLNGVSCAVPEGSRSATARTLVYRG